MPYILCIPEIRNSACFFIIVFLAMYAKFCDPSVQIWSRWLSEIETQMLNLMIQDFLRNAVFSLKKENIVLVVIKCRSLIFQLNKLESLNLRSILEAAKMTPRYETCQKGIKTSKPYNL